METIVAALLAAGACLLGAWWLMIRMPGESFPGPLPPLSPEERISAQRLERDVRRLAVDIGERSLSNPGGLVEAAAHVEREFRELGYAVASHDYEVQGKRVRNVEATLPSAHGGSEVVLVGAHYDSLAGTTGANDNASGVAAMLEIARQLRASPLPRALRFVAFVNEEPPYFNLGQMGSQRYAAAVAQRGDRIIAMMSLETLGYYSDAPGSQLYPFPLGLFYPSRGNFVAFVGNVQSRALVRRSVAAFRASVRFPSEGAAAPASIPGVSWSDHASFWAHAYPAMMITDTAPYRYPYYHTVHDTPEHVDFARLARVVHGIAAVVEALARKS